MEEIIKRADEFLNENSDATIDQLDKYLRKFFTDSQVEEYFELLAESLTGIDKVMEKDPVEMLMGGYDEQIKKYSGVTLVKFATEDRLRKLQLKEWSVWEKEPSTFEWEYDECETCFILEGDILISTEKGEEIEIMSGDLVQFQKGLKCTWTVRRKVKKHYKFGNLAI